TLSIALASKGINRAAQNGFMVPQPVLEGNLRANTAGLDLAKGTFATSPGGVGGFAGGDGSLALGTRPSTGSPASASGTARAAVAAPSSPDGVAGSSDAGVPVYRQSGQTAGLQEAVNTLKQREGKSRADL